MRPSQSPPTPALHIYNHKAVCQLCIVENMFWKKIVGESNSFWKIVILSTFKSGLVERLKHRHCKLENHERKQENGKKIQFVHLLQFVKSILTLLITALLRVKLNLFQFKSHCSFFPLQERMLNVSFYQPSGLCCAGTMHVGASVHCLNLWDSACRVALRCGTGCKWH